MVAQLDVDEVHVDLVGADVAFLSHVREGDCQVNEGVTAVVLREEKYGEMRAGGRGAVLCGF